MINIFFFEFKEFLFPQEKKNVLPHLRGPLYFFDTEKNRMRALWL